MLTTLQNWATEHNYVNSPIMQTKRNPSGHSSHSTELKKESYGTGIRNQVDHKLVLAAH